MARSVIAVLAGAVVWVVLGLGSDQVVLRVFADRVSADGRIDDPAILALVAAYVTLYEVIAAYIVGRIARRKPVTHALAFGLLQLCLGIVATIALFDTAPLWYHLISLGLILPAAWLGGRLAGKHVAAA